MYFISLYFKWKKTVYGFSFAYRYNPGVMFLHCHCAAKDLRNNGSSLQTEKHARELAVLSKYDLYFVSIRWIMHLDHKKLNQSMRKQKEKENKPWKGLKSVEKVRKHGNISPFTSDGRQGRSSFFIIDIKEWTWSSKS